MKSASTAGTTTITTTGAAAATPCPPLPEPPAKFRSSPSITWFPEKRLKRLPLIPPTLTPRSIPRINPLIRNSSSTMTIPPISIAQVAPVRVPSLPLRKKRPSRKLWLPTAWKMHTPLAGPSTTQFISTAGMRRANRLYLTQATALQTCTPVRRTRSVLR